MDPAKYNLKQAWNTLVEARKGNGISKAIYEKWACVNAMPLVGEDDLTEIKTYESFRKLHVQVWFIE